MARQISITVFFYICFYVTINAQFYTLPNQWMFQQIQDYNILSADTNISTASHPLNPFVVKKFSNIDTSYRLFKYIKNDPAIDMIFEKDVISVKHDEFHVRIDPLINFQKGKQLADTNMSLYTNTRGFIASVLFKNVYMETMLSENQSVFPDYIYDYSKSLQIVPGQGRWKLFKRSGFDYAFSAGIVSVQLGKNTNITIGTGKQKIGNGYRSLLLSDNAFVYPFLKIEQNWWKGKLQYICNYAVLNNLTSASVNIPPHTERLFQKKPFVYQYMNVAVFKHTRIGFFQGIMGESPDTKNVWKGDVVLFSPLIYSQMMYYGLNDENNVIVGMDFQQKMFKTLVVYAQFVLDNNDMSIRNNRFYGYQLGVKWLGKWNDWRVLFLSEWNDVKEGTYLSPVFNQYSNSSYSHFSQNMAYTIDNGSEFVSIFSLKKERWILSGQFNSQQRLVNTVNAKYYKVLFGFIINPSYNLMINFGIENRIAEKNNNYIYLQLQTSLYNVYYDF